MASDSSVSIVHLCGRFTESRDDEDGIVVASGNQTAEAFQDQKETLPDQTTLAYQYSVFTSQLYGSG